MCAGLNDNVQPAHVDEVDVLMEWIHNFLSSQSNAAYRGHLTKICYYKFSW